MNILPGPGRPSSAPRLDRGVILGQGQNILRKFETQDRFKVPSVFELMSADDETGTLQQMTLTIGHMHTIDEAENVLSTIMKDPEYKGRKFFIVRVDRVPVKGNFNPGVIKARQQGFIPQTITSEVGNPGFDRTTKEPDNEI